VELVGRLIHACARACAYSQCDIDALHTCIPWGYEFLRAEGQVCYRISCAIVVIDFRVFGIMVVVVVVVIVIVIVWWGFRKTVIDGIVERTFACAWYMYI
jgi:hypothetical protein